jgi:hypothetical protein
MAATATGALEKTIQEMADRAEIVDLESRKGRYADEKRFDDMADIRTQDSVSLYRNGELRLQGIDALREQGRATLSQFDRVQHVITNILVDLHGDTADIRANVIATHVYDTADPTKVWIVKGYYTDKAVRTANGWRLSQTALHRIWEQNTRNPGESH